MLGRLWQPLQGTLKQVQAADIEGVLYLQLRHSS
jgi:hypothetical protein